MIEKYDITAIDNIVCLPGEGLYRVAVTADIDLTDFMPYINGSVKGAKYMPAIHWIRFPFNGYPSRSNTTWQVAIKGREILIAKFSDRTVAAETAGELVEYLNSIDRARATITPSTKAWAAPNVMDILRLLPRTNCGKCGKQSCMAFATALAAEQVLLDACGELDPESPERLKLGNILCQ